MVPIHSLGNALSRLEQVQSPDTAWAYISELVLGQGKGTPVAVAQAAMLLVDWLNHPMQERDRIAGGWHAAVDILKREGLTPGIGLPDPPPTDVLACMVAARQVIANCLLNTPPEKFRLTDKQATCLKHLAAGKGHKDVALELNIGISAVEKQLRNARLKLFARTTEHAVSHGLRLKAVSSEARRKDLADE